MYSNIAANKRNTLIIMASFVGIIGAIGWAISYLSGNSSTAFFIVGIAIVYAIIQYFLATKLAIAMTGAREIQKNDAPEYYRIVENLAITMGMPMPKVYVIDDPAPNAFAAGRDPDHAIVAATTGLIDVMSKPELEAVMAHEMGHVKNYDIRVSMVAFALVSVIGLISDIALRMMFSGNNRDSKAVPIVMIVGIIAIILAPILATLIQLAISRQREYLADATGALTTRNPEALANALEKLQTHGQPMRRQSQSTSHLFFSSPLKAGAINKLFATHPPLEERIARLRNSADKF